MEYAAGPVRNEMERSTGKFSNDTHSLRTMVFVGKLYCSIYRKIPAGFSTEMESAQRHFCLSPGSFSSDLINFRQLGKNETARSVVVQNGIFMVNSLQTLSLARNILAF